MGCKQHQLLVSFQLWDRLIHRQKGTWSRSIFTTISLSSFMDHIKQFSIKIWRNLRLPVHKVSGSVKWINYPSWFISQLKVSTSSSCFFTNELSVQILQQRGRNRSIQSFNEVIELKDTRWKRTLWLGKRCLRWLKMKSSHALSVSVTKSTYIGWIT